jgi:hypothetical protein
MKNLFKATFVAFLAASMISCGGVDKSNFVGEWTPDLGSVEIELSSAIPSEYTGELSEVKSEMKKNQDQADKIKMEFKEDGTLTVGPEHDTKDFSWDVDGSNLVISGDLEGKKFSASFEVVESSADEFTLKLTGTSVMEQAKAQYGKEVDQAMEEIPGLGMLNIEKILEESWASMKFKKKSNA